MVAVELSSERERMDCPLGRGQIIERLEDLRDALAVVQARMKADP
jgi:hypothetical protein